MMLSARSDPETKVAALRAGAIDYVAKPFSFDELLERVRIHLRRSSELDPDGAHLSRCNPRVEA